jgi:predicted lipoprotein with Yx(FWY)xxD motif
MAAPGALIAALAMLLIAGCGGGSKSAASATTTSPTTTTTTAAAPASTPVHVSTSTVPGLGVVLVNAQGHTLYAFMRDAHHSVTCVGSCAAVWPPLKLPSGSHLAASGQAKLSLMGTYPDPEGGRVVTYAGWPLYTYVSDTGPGTAHGQALNLNGGLWYVLSPSGALITKKP